MDKASDIKEKLLKMKEETEKIEACLKNIFKEGKELNWLSGIEIRDFEAKPQLYPDSPGYDSKHPRVISNNLFHMILTMQQNKATQEEIIKEIEEFLKGI